MYNFSVINAPFTQVFTSYKQCNDIANRALSYLNLIHLIYFKYIIFDVNKFENMANIYNLRKLVEFSLSWSKNVLSALVGVVLW
jgi:hypothetical protein